MRRRIRQRDDDSESVEVGVQMKRIRAACVHLCTDDAGVTSIEYALIGALIAMVIVAAVASTGTALSTFLGEVARCVTEAAQGRAC
jgi:pilus assembly protein Flp/PilA